MFTPSDEELESIMDDAADAIVEMVDMELDEGEWVSRLHRRCDQLGLSVAEGAQIREVIEEVLCLRIARNALERIKIGLEEARERPGRVFLQGSGWIEEVGR